MEENKRGFDELNDIGDFNERYRHYAELGEEKSDASAEIPVQEAEIVKPHDEYEDISSYSDEGMREFYSSFIDNEENTDTESVELENENKKPDVKESFFKKNNYRNAKITALIVVIALLLGSGGFLFYIWWSTRSDGYGINGVEYNEINEDDYLSDENLDFEAMGDVDADSLNGWLKAWAENGEKMYSKNVINVLLCGVDSKDGTATNARSDSMILVSVNKKTEKITMVSLLRDSWTYMNIPREDGTSYDYYFKLNSAYSFGGPATLIETIENNFKIEIDQYIAVDFNSFPKLIDALGGVTVEVQQYESDYIRRTSSQTDFPSGKAKLTGKQALIYSRIRHCDSDSDVSRTRRQRNVIKALIASAKTATKGQLLNAFKQVSGYMRTGYTQSEVLSLIVTAYAHNWMDFEMTELMLPNKDYEDRFSTYINSQSCWVVDYALCAQKLQNAIYGETNIFLSEDRTSALDFVTSQRTTSSYNSDYSSNSYDDDDDSDDYNYTTNNYNYSYTTQATQSDYGDYDDYESDATEATQATEATEAPQEEDNGNLLDNIINRNNNEEE